jgi:hypothetical protein
MLRRMMMAANAAGGGDPHWANVVSLHNWPGADGSTTYTDAKGKTWTGYGNAQIDTDYGQALLLDGTGDYLTTPDSADFNFGSGDLTEEGYFRESARAAIRQIIGQHTTESGGDSNSSFILLSDNGYLKFSGYVGATNYQCTSSSQHALDTIHHYAACRDGGNLRLYLNGVQAASIAISGSINNSTMPLTIGAVMNGTVPNSGGYYFNGRLLSRRMTKGVCRYPSGTTFTPPGYPFATS